MNKYMSITMGMLLGALLAVVLYVNAMAASGCTVDLSWNRQSALHISGGPFTMIWWDGFHWNNLGILSSSQPFLDMPVRWMTEGDTVYGVDNHGAVRCSAAFAG